MNFCKKVVGWKKNPLISNIIVKKILHLLSYDFLNFRALHIIRFGLKSFFAKVVLFFYWEYDK